MFGWIRRRLLARRCRKALQTVDSYARARARMAEVRWAHTPPPTCAPAFDGFVRPPAGMFSPPSDLSPGGYAIDGMLITLKPGQDLEAVARDILIRTGRRSARFL
ncbi:hypothetical protein [Pseudomonas aeruginosa]|uniref:hypothetical protein n=1 Tax=Pseudomonas aeruginosa TaxID=287 RepID=UPI00053DF335|nr:hypothetical protein [Pseudomonas aeruginosa]